MDSAERGGDREGQSDACAHRDQGVLDVGVGYDPDTQLGWTVVHDL